MHYVYILLCSDQTLYTGYTIDLDRRLNQHNQGLASKYTRGRLPVQMIYHEVYKSKSDALKREIAIKKLERKEKLNLIENKK